MMGQLGAKYIVISFSYNTTVNVIQLCAFVGFNYSN